MIPTFIRFYNYTNSQVLNEYARTFFTLVNSMFEIKASELLDDIMVNNATQENVESLKKQKKGLGKIIDEVKIAISSRSNK